MPVRTIFRETALEAYRRGAEKDVIPRLVSRPIVWCRWLLLAVLVGAAALAWVVWVPTYLTASGVVVGPEDARAYGAQTAVVLVVPRDSVNGVRVGRPVRLELESSGTVAQGAVAAVEPGVVTPETARRRHPALGPDLVPQPSVVVVVRLQNTEPSGFAAGSRVTGQVETGAQRLIALLPSLPSRPAG